MTGSTGISPAKESEPVIISLIQRMVMERRSKVRYPLALAVRYRTLGRELHSGVGQAVNLSSGGALVYCQHELGVGVELEMNMEWPSLLDGSIPLQLVAFVSLARCGPSYFAVSFRRYQFRTLRSKLLPQNRLIPITSAKTKQMNSPGRRRIVPAILIS
jgi:hypothetical protein